MVASSSSSSLVLPGQPLAGPSNYSNYVAGSGTYRRSSHILSSLVGERAVDPSPSTYSSTSSAKGKAPERGEVLSVKGATARFPIPETDSVVLARVVRVSPRQATCTILVANGVPCGLSSSISSKRGKSNDDGIAHLLLGIAASDDGNPDNLFQGVIRSQDVRATNKDSVKMHESFRPGDIVRAVVISLGDARSYYLSTASNELGVVYAISSKSTAPDYIMLDDDNISTEAASGDAVRARPAAVPLQPVSWAEMRDPTTGAIEKRKVAKPLVI